MSGLWDIYSTFLDGKDVWWCLSQEIPWILLEPDDKWCTVSIAISNLVTVNHRFCFLQVNEAYQPQYKRRSLRLCGPYLATSKFSSINKVNTKYNGQCSKKETFTITGRQIRQIENALNTTTSSSKSKQQRLGNRKGPSTWSGAQLAIQNDACGGDMIGNKLCREQREGEMDRGLCGKRDHWNKKVSWSRRDCN